MRSVLKKLFTTPLLTLSACLLLVSLPAAAGKKAAPAPAKIGGSPVDQMESRESGSTAVPGMPRGVRQDLLDSPNDEVAAIARAVKNGTATMVQQRAYYWMSRSLGRSGTPPDEWKAKALEARAQLPAGSRVPGAIIRNDGKSAAPDAPSAFSWVPLGPTNYVPNGGVGLVQGAGTALWVDPAAPTTHWLAGFDGGGAWNTTDGGTTWTPIFDSAVTLSVGAITVDTTVIPNIIYIGTAAGNFGGGEIDGTSTGVYKSTDGGATFVRHTIPWPTVVRSTYNGPLTAYARGIRRLVIDPNNNQRIWAAASGGLMVSTDAGVTWTMNKGTNLPWTGSPLNCGTGVVNYITDIVIDGTTNPSTVYTANGRPYDSGACATPNQARLTNGVYRSTDNGLNWTKIASPGAGGFTAIADCAGMGRLAMAMAPSNHNKIYLMVHRPGAGASCGSTADSYEGTYVTTNANAASPTWTRASTTNFCSAQCWYDMHGTVDPTNDTVAYFGGLDLYQTTNSATTLTSRTAWNGTPFVHADHHHLVMINSTTLLEATDGGIFRVTVNPAGGTVTPTNRNGGGLMTTEVYSIGQDPVSATTIHGGLQDNGETCTTTAPTGWTEVAGGDGGYSATDQTTPANNYEEYVYAGISRSTTGACGGYSCIQNFSTCTAPLNNCTSGCIPDSSTTTGTEFIAPFVLDPNAQAVMTTGSVYLYRNANAPGSTTWAKITRNGTATAGFVDPNNTGYQDINSIHVSAGGGKTCAIGGGPGSAISCNIVVGGSAGALWRTATGNQPFTEIDKISLGTGAGATPKRPVNKIITDPTSQATASTKVIVAYDGFDNDAVSSIPATAQGHLFQTLNGGTSWTNISPAIGDQPILSLALDPTDVNIMYIGTYGGVYQMSNIWTATPTLTSYNFNLPNVAVDWLEFTNATSPKRLRAATYGRGIWELTTVAGCSAPTIANNTAADVNACAATGNKVDWTLPSVWGDSSGTRTFDVLRGVTVIATGLAGTTVTYTDATAVVGTAYTYTVRANNGCGSSTTTAGASATDVNDTTTPSSPVHTLLKSSPNINFTWPASTDPDSAVTYTNYSAATPNPGSWTSRNTTATLAWSNATDLATASTVFFTTTAKDVCTESAK
jgi:hypothetical protein